MFKPKTLQTTLILMGVKYAAKHPHIPKRIVGAGKAGVDAAVKSFKQDTSVSEKTGKGKGKKSGGAAGANLIAGAGAITALGYALAKKLDLDGKD